jgi:uncharacterized membrane protein
MVHMSQFPAWNTLHPLVIHFPIVLLLIAPIFVLAGALTNNKERARFAFITALLLLVAGTGMGYVAQATGEAARNSTQESPQVRVVLEQHEELAETTVLVFSVLTAVFGIMVLAPIALRRDPGRVLGRALPLVFLIFYSAGVVILVNTAHHGGRLVHQLGVRAGNPSAAQVVSNTDAVRGTDID